MTSRIGGVALGVILSLTGSYPVPAQEAAPPPTLALYALLAVPGDSAVVATTARRWHVRVTGHRYGVLRLAIRADSLTLDRRALLDSLRAIRRVNGTPAVEGAEWDQSTTIPEGSASASLPSWGLDTVRAAGAWAQGVTGAGVEIAILDTGFNPSHPEFAGRVLGCRPFGIFAVDSATCTQPTTSCKWHGQHVASTAAGATRGVAPGASLWLLTVFDGMGSNCVSWASSQVAALRWALDSTESRVANMSLGGSASASRDAMLSQWQAAGRIVVAASGNNGGTTVSFPAASDHAWAVGAITSTRGRPSYSQRGPELDFAAPGSGINGASGASGYVSKSGTSMASPHVAGIVALVLSADPSLSWQGAYDLMRQCSRDLGTAGHDTSYGWGLPRADCAVALARGVSLQPTTADTPVRVGSPYPVVGCRDVTSPAAWTVGDHPAWLTLTTTTSQVCYRVDSDPGLAVGDVITIDLIGVP